MLIQRYAIGLATLLVSAEISQILRWLWEAEILPLIGLVLLVLLIAFAGVAAWLHWCKSLNYDAYFEQRFPLFFVALGFMLGGFS